MSAIINKIKDWRVEKFLCCFELEVGTKITSIIFIILGVLALVTAPFSSENVTLGGAIIAALLYIVPSIFLFRGVTTRNAKYVMWWIYAFIVISILFVIGFCILLITYIVKFELLSALAYIFGAVIQFVIHIYLLICVHSYYHTIASN